MSRYRKNELRERLGLSQQELADLLGVNRHSLAKSELCLRNLPPKASFRETRLAMALYPPVTNITAEQENSDEGAKAIAASKKIRRFAEECAYQALTAENKLEAMKEAAGQASEMLRIAPAIRAFTQEKTVAMASLNLLERLAEKKLRDNGAEEQAWLQLRISGLRHQGAEARKLLDSQLINEPVLRLD